MKTSEIIDKVYAEYNKNATKEYRDFSIDAWKTFTDQMKFDWYVISLKQEEYLIKSITEKILLDNKDIWNSHKNK